MMTTEHYTAHRERLMLFPSLSMRQYPSVIIICKRDNNLVQIILTWNVYKKA